MNLPNKITVARIFLIPIFLVILFSNWNWGTITFYGDTLNITQLVAALIFIFASATDWIDGHLARKHNLVTNLGKFLDPLADKLLVSAALVALIDITDVPAWMVIIIISREFAVTGLRLILAGSGEVHAAGMLGKIKTWTQIVAISAYLLNDIPLNMIGIPIGYIAMWIAVIFTVWSGADYFIKNKEVFRNSK
ncbi:MAG: CDP-diacylglycerol--glycerol-3-phosphate 3-phosphatidyltransferase [Bacillaceae bacterium]